jgi:hypothetical protein
MIQEMRCRSRQQCSNRVFPLQSNLPFQTTRGVYVGENHSNPALLTSMCFPTHRTTIPSCHPPPPQTRSHVHPRAPEKQTKPAGRCSPGNAGKLGVCTHARARCIGARVYVCRACSVLHICGGEILTHLTMGLGWVWLGRGGGGI